MFASALLVIAGLYLLLTANRPAPARFAGDDLTVVRLSPANYEAIREIVAPIAATTIIAIALAAFIHARLYRDRARVLRSMFNTRARLVIALITVAGFAVRALSLVRPIRTDEADTLLYYATQPWTVALSVYGAPNNHLLSTLLVRLFYLFGGPSPAIIRIPSLIAGVLLIPATAIAAKMLVRDETEESRGDAIACFAAAIVASSVSMIDYSALARGYSLVTLLTVIAIVLGAAMLRSPGTAGRYALPLALVVAAGAFTIPTMVYSAAAVFVWIALRAFGAAPEERRSLVPAIIAAAALTAVFTAVFYLPVLRISGAEVLTSNRYVRPLPFGAWIPALARSAKATLELWSGGTGAAGAVATLLLLLAGIGVQLRRRSKMAPLWMSFASSVLVLLALQRVAPYPRVWLMMFPLVAITIAEALVTIVEHFAGVDRMAVPAMIIAIVVCAIGCLFAASGRVAQSKEAGSMPDAHAVALFLKNSIRPGDRVCASNESDVILMYEFRRLGVPLEVLRAAPSPSAQIFVVMNGLYGETPERVLSSNGFGPGAFRVLNAVRFEQSSVGRATITTAIRAREPDSRRPQP